MPARFVTVLDKTEIGRLHTEYGSGGQDGRLTSGDPRQIAVSHGRCPRNCQASDCEAFPIWIHSRCFEGRQIRHWRI